MWKVATTRQFDEWFMGLEASARIEVLAKVQLLKEFGPQLSRPHADTLKGSCFANMKELRAKTSTAAMRVAFAFDPARNAILLIGGNKAGVNQKRFYQSLISQADKLLREHLKNM